MNHRRAILCLFVVAATIIGTTGYSTVQSERTVDIQVAGNSEAYLVIQETGTSIDNGSSGKVLELTNQFSESVDLTISVTTNDDITSQGLNKQTIEPGETAALEVKCEKTQTSSGSITVDIEADGDAVSFEKSGHQVTVNCEGT